MNKAAALIPQQNPRLFPSAIADRLHKTSNPEDPYEKSFMQRKIECLTGAYKTFMNVNQLPIEVLDAIFRRLSSLNWYQCALVCRQWYKLVMPLMFDIVYVTSTKRMIRIAQLFETKPWLSAYIGHMVIEAEDVNSCQCLLQLLKSLFTALADQTTCAMHGLELHLGNQMPADFLCLLFDMIQSVSSKEFKLEVLMLEWKDKTDSKRRIDLSKSAICHLLNKPVSSALGAYRFADSLTTLHIDGSTSSDFDLLNLAFPRCANHMSIEAAMGSLDSELFQKVSWTFKFAFLQSDHRAKLFAEGFPDFIAEFVQNLQCAPIRLQSLHFSCCEKITEGALFTFLIGPGLVNLQSLRFEKCYGVVAMNEEVQAWVKFRKQMSWLRDAYSRWNNGSCSSFGNLPDMEVVVI